MDSKDIFISNPHLKKIFVNEKGEYYFNAQLIGGKYYASGQLVKCIEKSSQEVPATIEEEIIQPQEKKSKKKK